MIVNSGVVWRVSGDDDSDLWWKAGDSEGLIKRYR